MAVLIQHSAFIIQNSPTSCPFSTTLPLSPTMCQQKHTKNHGFKHKNYFSITLRAQKIMLAKFVYSNYTLIFAYPLKQNMPASLLERIPKRKYSKKEICQILADPENFITGNIAAITIGTRATENLKRDVLRSGLLQQFGITEQDYDHLKIFTVTQGELILNKLM